MLVNLRIQSGVQGGSIMMWSAALERKEGLMKYMETLQQHLKISSRKFDFIQMGFPNGQ